MEKKFYVTTSIAYVNAAPHIGFALELAQADVLARYHRLLGEKVFFLTGTDEHGQKQYETAKKMGKDPQEWSDENAAKFKQLTKDLNISNDDFIRTTDQERHWPAVQKLWNELKSKGDIYKAKYSGFYCVGCEGFVTEKDLIDGKCPNHQKKPNKIEEENWFFALSRYSKKIGELIESDKIKIVPKSRKNEILNVIKDGLQDVSFSRPKSALPWGIPVSDDTDQVMYVWCDALTNYLSAIGYEADKIRNPKSEIRNPKQIQNSKFKTFWPADVHCIGKDILRFHAGIWPGMLLSAGLPLPKNIFVHGFIKSGGQKMSKSLGNVIDPFKCIKKYGADALRYYLLRKIPSSGDGDFTEEKFAKAYTSDLANDLGNLVLRVATLAEKAKIELRITAPDMPDLPASCPAPGCGRRGGSRGGRVKHESRGFKSKVKSALDNFQIDRAMDIIWQDISAMNKEIDRLKLWKLIREDSDMAKTILKKILSMLHASCFMLHIFLPQTAERMARMLTGGKKEVLFPKKI